MTNTPTTAPLDPSVPATPAEQEKQGPSATRIALMVIAGGVGFLLIGFIVSLVFALTNPGAASGFQIIRDFFIIALALEGIVIGAAMAVLVLQLARLTNLLQNEIKPILKEASSTVQTVKGTTAFIGKNVADPMIRASGFFAGMLALMRELLGLRRVLRRSGGQPTATPVGDDRSEG